MAKLLYDDTNSTFCFQQDGKLEQEILKEFGKTLCHWNVVREYIYWREVQKCNAAIGTYLAYLAFHPNEWIHQTTSRSVKSFLYCPHIV